MLRKSTYLLFILVTITLISCSTFGNKNDDSTILKNDDSTILKNDDPTILKFGMYNDLENYSEVKIYDDIEIQNYEFDGEYIKFRYIFDSNEEITFNNKKMNIKKSFDKNNIYENLYFYDNNYYYLQRGLIEGNEHYSLNILLSECVVSFNKELHYYIPFVNTRLCITSSDELYGDYSFEVLKEFYSKYTGIVIDDVTQTIEIESEVVNIIYNIYKTKIYTKFDFINRETYVTYNNETIIMEI